MRKNHVLVLAWLILGMSHSVQADILWHNASTGETQVWLMDGHKLIGRATVLGENGSPAFVGLPWSIVGTPPSPPCRSCAPGLVCCGVSNGRPICQPECIR